MGDSLGRRFMNGNTHRPLRGWGAAAESTTPRGTTMGDGAYAPAVESVVLGDASRASDPRVSRRRGDTDRRLGEDAVTSSPHIGAGTEPGRQDVRTTRVSSEGAASCNATGPQGQTTCHDA